MICFARRNFRKRFYFKKIEPGAFLAQPTKPLPFLPSRARKPGPASPSTQQTGTLLSFFLFLSLTRGTQRQHRRFFPKSRLRHLRRRSPAIRPIPAIKALSPSFLAPIKSRRPPCLIPTPPAPSHAPRLQQSLTGVAPDAAVIRHFRRV